ncbi:8977_t:CDS:2, partial [Scutellospora calospora]
MSELLSVNKPQEMSTSIVNEDIDESWFKNADNLMFDDDINLDYKLSSAEDVEFFKLLEEVDSNESFSRDLEGEISETFPNNEDIIVLEDDELIDSDNIDNGVILKDEENESDLYFGKRSPQKESDLPNSGQSRCILEYEGQKNHIYVKSNKYVGEFMQDLKDDLIPDKIHDCEVVLTFLDENIDDFRLDNKYSQEFTLGKIITVHDKYRKSHDLNTAYLHVVMTLQDRFISQYKKYDDVIGGRAQNPIVVGDSSPESFDDGDNILSKSPVEDIITKIDQASGTGNSFFNPSKDASLPLAKDVNDEQFTDIREGND